MGVANNHDVLQTFKFSMLPAAQPRLQRSAQNAHSTSPSPFCFMGLAISAGENCPTDAELDPSKPRTSKVGS